MASVYQTLLDIEREGQLNPAQRTQLETLKRQQGATGAGGNDFVAQALALQKAQFAQAQEFGKPAIETLRESGQAIPGIYQKQYETLEAGREPLKARYDALLEEVSKGTREQATAEFTRRGIPLSSGVVGQTVESRLAPQIKSIGAERLTGLQGITEMQTGLSTQQAQQEQQLAMAISAIQSAMGPGAVQSAQGIYGMQQQSQQQAAQLALQRWQTEQQQAMAGQQLGFQQEQAAWQQPWQEQLWQYQLDKPYYKPSQTVGGGITPFPD